MATTERTHFMDRDSIVERLAYAIANDYGWDDPGDLEQARENAELAVDTLVGDATLFPTERWDDECHVCLGRVGDHTIEGKHPKEETGENLLMQEALKYQATAIRSLMGAKEVATALGVSKQRVAQLHRGIGKDRADPRFPKPVAELAATPVWLAENIEAYRRNR